jgi:3-methyladenine DNA glycosylase/8-oxoguanine DNA glycosylase
MGLKRAHISRSRPVGAKAGLLEVVVRPAAPYRLPTYGGGDRVMRIRSGVATRLLRPGGSPVVVRAWQPEADRVVFRAEAVEPAALSSPILSEEDVEPASGERLELAIERMRFALAVDDDLGEFRRTFRADPLLGPLLRRRPHFRIRRRPWPWEALSWAVVEQLIESERAATIKRRIVGRWGSRCGEGRDALRDVPDPALIAGRAPAELQSMDLSARRAVALRAVARAAAKGHCDLGDAGDDRRLLAVPEIGPWTVQCLGLFGRGEWDSLPAGDLVYIKLVGRLARLGRRATVDEVEEFYAPYAPFRGLAGILSASGLHRAAAQGPPLRHAV